MRQKRVRLAAAVAVVAIASVVATTAFAGGGREVRDELSGDQEVPVVLTDAEGKFKAKLFSDRGNGPPGTPPCPPDPGTVSGTITAAQVVNTAAQQGIAAGELDELIDAIRDGWTYANVHSTLAPSGEARGQLNDDGGDDDD